MEIEAEWEAVPIAGGAGVIASAECMESGAAPEGNKNSLKHGFYTAEAIETRRMIAALTRRARELVGMV